MRIGESLTTLETLRSIAELAERAEQGSTTAPHLGHVTIAADRTGLRIAYEAGDFDLQRWLLLVERPISRGEIDLSLLGDLDQPAGWVAPGLEAISQAAAQDLGFSIDELLDTLTVLLRHCLDRRYEFLGFDGLPVGPTISRAAVDYLTFSDDDMSIESLRPSHTRHQHKRVWTSPLLKTGGRYYIFRDVVFEAVLRWARYLTQGDWPVPRNTLRETAPRLHRALEDRSRESGPLFERYVGSRLDETGLPWASLKNGARVGSVKLSREIDSVVIDAAQRKIHVLEFKNMSSDQNAKSLQNELKKFLGEYADKLDRSVREVELDKLAFVKRVSELNGSSSGDVGEAASWSVVAAFVFSSHSPIECLTAPQSFVGTDADRVKDLFAPPQEMVELGAS